MFSIVASINALGRYAIFCFQSIRRIFQPAVNLNLLFQQMEFIGVRSIGIIILASIMIGAVFGISFGSIFQIFGAESMIGAAASVGLSKELAPVISAFLVTGRSGAAMAAEIATMKVNEQIDALRVMAVNPISFLVAPRVLASVLMMPLLSCFFLLWGLLSAYFVGVELFDVDVGIFLENIRWISTPKHIFQGMQKAAIFGAIFSTISCYKGFYAGGGAKGVGAATTQAVVYSLVTVLVTDFFITYFQMESTD